jgi:hypothetical protein
MVKYFVIRIIVHHKLCKQEVDTICKLEKASKGNLKENENVLIILLFWSVEKSQFISCNLTIPCVACEPKANNSKYMASI